MVNISEPYIIHYPRIVAVADETGEPVELIEFFDCVGGAMWTQHHYAQSPVVNDVRCVGSTTRYSDQTGIGRSRTGRLPVPRGHFWRASWMDTEIAITYIGMGGGGVGAAACRSDAAGVSCGAKAIRPGGESGRCHPLAPPQAAGADRGR